jgi:predicted metal-dependent TIM-barrel fold hydrolase
LADKKKGVRLLLDCLKSREDIAPGRVTFDHMEEHTIRPVLDAGFWAAMTIYPQTKNSPSRVVDTVERYGLERMMVDASGDWGPSDPGTLHDAIIEMRRRGHPESAIETLFYNNPCRFLGQCPKFAFKPENTA